MIIWLKNLFRTPTATELALRELAEAKRDLLKAQDGRDYANAMCMYSEERILRLEKMLAMQGILGDKK